MYNMGVPEFFRENTKSQKLECIFRKGLSKYVEELVGLAC